MKKGKDTKKAVVAPSQSEGKQDSETASEKKAAEKEEAAAKESEAEEAAAKESEAKEAAAVADKEAAEKADKNTKKAVEKADKNTKKAAAKKAGTTARRKVRVVSVFVDKYDLSVQHSLGEVLSFDAERASDVVGRGLAEYADEEG